MLRSLFSLIDSLTSFPKSGRTRATRRWSMVDGRGRRTDSAPEFAGVETWTPREPRRIGAFMVQAAGVLTSKGDRRVRLLVSCRASKIDRPFVVLPQDGSGLMFPGSSAIGTPCRKAFRLGPMVCQRDRLGGGDPGVVRAATEGDPHLVTHGRPSCIVPGTVAHWLAGCAPKATSEAAANEARSANTRKNPSPSACLTNFWISEENSL